MGSDEGMRVVGTIRTIALHALGAKFVGVTARQVAKIQLDVEHAADADGTVINAQNLTEVHFQGPAELVPLFNPGDRVQIITSEPSGMHIASIKPAPLAS